MATQFDPNNPFNIRGVNISPALPDGTDVKNNVYYYLIFIDVVQNQPGGVDETKFIPSNFQETGAVLNYNYTAGYLQPPTGAASEQIQTYALPLYTNQQIDKPDATGNNLTVTITYYDTNGTAYAISGNPNFRKPPVLEVLSGINPIQGVQVSSETVSGASVIVFLANSGNAGIINNASMYSFKYTINAPGDPTPIVTYPMYFQFLTQGEGQPWQAQLQPKDHPVAVIGCADGNANSYPSITVVQPNVQVSDANPSDFGTTYQLPLSDMQYISM